MALFPSLFFAFRGIPCFLGCFPFFSKGFRGSEETENPCIFVGFPCVFPNERQGKEDQGRSSKIAQVLRIRLFMNKIVGLIPRAVASWSLLENVSLSDNTLSGLIPDAVSSWQGHLIWHQDTFDNDKRQKYLKLSNRLSLEKKLRELFISK